MIWAWLLFAAALAAPLAIELSRQRMEGFLRKAAPGHLAHLSQGITHFRWIGPEHGPVVVCVHGLTTPSYVWDRLAQGLADSGFRVLTYDLYGRGYSDRVKGLQDRRFFLRQLDDLLAAVEVEGDFVLIGYSMGGSIATAFAASQHSRLRQLVLIAPAGMGRVGGPLLRAMVKVPVLGTWAMLALYPAILRRGLRAAAARDDTMTELIDRQQDELRTRGYVPAVLQSLRGILDENLQPDHRTLALHDLRVMAFWGSDDKVIPLDASDVLREWNPKVDHFIIDDAGHELTYTHADRILKHLLPRLS